MATVPTPFDATSGQKLTASQWDSQVRDVLLWLMGNGTNGVYPRVHAWDNAGVVFVAATSKLFNMNAEVYDTDTMHDPVTNNSRITFTTAGLYEVNFAISLSPSGSFTSAVVQSRLNSGGSSAGGTTIRTQPFVANGTQTVFAHHVFQRFWNAGDYMELFINTTGSGGTCDNTSQGSRVFARYIAVA